MSAATTRRRQLVVHVGPSRDAHGGIAKTIALYSRSPLVDRYDMRFVASMGASAGRLRHLRFVTAMVQVAAVCAAHRGAIVHLHVASHGSFARKSAIASVARLLGAKVIAHIHGGGFADFAVAKGERRAKKVRGLLMRSAAVLALSESWAHRLEELGAEQVWVVPNPVEIPPSASHGRESTRMVFVGHVVAHKGVQTLAESVALLATRGVAAELRVLGAGPEAETLVSTAPVTVTHLGWVESDVVYRELDESALFVLPSLTEGVPLALLEAMAHGLACVCTAVGGVPDVVTRGVTGLLVEPGDPTALADALESLLSDPLLRVSLGDSAREYVREQHSLHAVSRRVSEVYDSLSGEATSDSGRRSG